MFWKPQRVDEVDQGRRVARFDRTINLDLVSIEQIRLRFYWDDARQVIVSNAVYPLRNLMPFKSGGQPGAHEVSKVVEVGIRVQPGFDLLAIQDYRHSRVDIGNVYSRFCRNEGTAVERSFTLSTVPLVPYCRDAERPAAGKVNPERTLLRMAGLPLVESVGHGHAASLPEGVHERWFRRDGFRARIDEQWKRAGRVGPGRNQTPTNHGRLRPAVLSRISDHDDVVRRCNVVPATDIQRLDVEQRGPLSRRRHKRESSAHTGKLHVGNRLRDSVRSGGTPMPDRCLDDRPDRPRAEQAPTLEAEGDVRCARQVIASVLTAGL